MNRSSRRQILYRAGGVAALALGIPSVSAPEERKLKVVVTGGHPGDPEYGCGGTAARFSDAGHDVVLLYLNRGERGVAGKSLAEAGAIRAAEARKACEILKARPLFAAQQDGAAVVDSDRYDAFGKMLEAEQPDVLFTQWPIDNHRDHRATSTLAYDAWLRLGKKAALYYYEVSDGEDTLMFAPANYVDITVVERRKKAACYAHASQAPDKFYALQEQVMRFRGVERGFKFAEAFLRHTHSREGLLPA